MNKGGRGHEKKKKKKRLPGLLDLDLLIYRVFLLL